MPQKLHARRPNYADSRQNPAITSWRSPCSLRIYNERMPGSDEMKPADSSQPSSEGFDAPGLKLTYDDFLLFPDDGKRHELIDGEHYVTPSPNIRHQDISGRLHLLIGTGCMRIGSADLLRPARCALLDVRRRRARSAVRLERTRG